MTTHVQGQCRVCGKTVGATQQVCPYCGALLIPLPEQVIVTGERQLTLTGDTMSIRDLMIIVEAGIAFWRRQYEASTGVVREQAGKALRELSQILASLAHQIGQGRETIRITTRLPAQRQYPLVCPLCGRGNRAGARFCVSCGSPLSAPWQISPPLPPLKTRIAVRSHVGQVRSTNEDTVYAGMFSLGEQQPFAALLLVADGMGGAAAGEVASQLASETIKTFLQQTLNETLPDTDEQWLACLQGAMQAAHERIVAAARADPRRAGMGTTATLALITHRHAYLAHVGDSRAYLITPGTGDEAPVYIQLTTDHTIVARLVDIGQLSPEAARTHLQRHILYRSLGADQPLAIDTHVQPLAAGDVLLICSDGLYNHVTDEELARLALADEPIQAASALIDLANQRGGHDNISVALARIETAPTM